MSRSPLLLMAAFLASSGCAGKAATRAATVSDSAGVRIATSPGTDRPLPWRFVEETRLGGAESGPESFTAASATMVRTIGDDRIAVFDRDRMRLEVFDATGRPVGGMGGPGGGPGEVLFGFDQVDAGPTELAVFDFGKSALVRWSLDGGILSEQRPTGGLGAWNGIALRGDTLLVGLEENDSLRTVHRLTMITPGDTTVLDSLVAPPRRMVEFSCFAAQLPPMFAPRLAWRAGADRIAVTRQAEYRIDLFADGRLAFSIRRASEPVPTTPEDASRMHPDGWSVSFQGGGECTIAAAEVAAKTGMADRLPVISELAFGPAGTLWARRHTFPGEPPVTDVFDREGVYLGTVTGRGVPLGALGPDRILFPIEDPATGITVIGIFRIERPDGEGADTT